ncbi:hypothetical protein QF037_005119 [Streptomyces canus]|uniref:hypothetical protein n=1 Tax=Streptomyces canus TaxID=58343 RepID=UPI00277D1D5E|nr:hypothetical protein [Streptomyces canus]MDQ0600774.1 hypothetical protein [Streptomyces canus]
MIFFQLVGTILQFVISRLVQTRLGFAGSVLLALAPIVIRLLLPRILRTMHSSPGWWAALLLLALLALSLQA